VSGSNEGLGPFGRSFIGEFPTLGTLSLLAVTFLFSAIFSLGDIILFLVLFILSSSLSVYLSYNFIEPHFNSKPRTNKIGGVNQTSSSLESRKRRLISGSERPKEIISFKDAIRSFFKNWADFRGRASRSEYNWILLFIFLIQLPLSLLSFFLETILIISEVEDSLSSLFVLFLYLIVNVFAFVLWLVLIIPQITILIRRLHDIGYSGWHSLTLFFVNLVLTILMIILFLLDIPLVILVISLLILITLSIIIYVLPMVLPGDNVSNKYGPIPTNKLNPDGTNLSANDIWDLSGSKL
jgi:uncharacterized membrane protein YhaH (DUF805 family)